MGLDSDDLKCDARRSRPIAEVGNHRQHVHAGPMTTTSSISSRE
jgi:hypothetical protein